MSSELRRPSVIYYVHILCIASEPPCLLSVNTHVFKVYREFVQKTGFAKCSTVLLHSTQMNRLRLADYYSVNQIIMHCCNPHVSLPVHPCYTTMVTIFV